MNLPYDAYRWNRAILGSFKKGIVVHQASQPIDACPYGDKRKPDGRLSWPRSFIAAWRDSWTGLAPRKTGDATRKTGKEKPADPKIKRGELNELTCLVRAL